MNARSAATGKAMAVVALAGAATIAVLLVASADAVTLCKANENPTCAEENRYRVPFTVEAKLPKMGSVSFAASPAPSSTCTSATGSGESTVAGTPLLGEVQTITLGSCSTNCTTVEARNLPWNVELEAAGGGNGFATMTGSGLGNPGVKLSSCMPAATCVYGGASVSGEVEGGAPAKGSFAFELNREEGNKLVCGPTLLVAGSYIVNVPSELFVSALP